MYLGTHNSATGGKLVWWLRPFAWLLHPTSRCQDRTIEQQLKDGVRLFNLQVTMYRGEWHFSHGLCIYEEEIYSTLSKMLCYATAEKPIYFQLYLDKNWLTGQDKERFKELVSECVEALKGEHLVLLCAWIEGTDKYPHKTGYNLNIEEHYWTKTWAFRKVRPWLDRLPLPRYHAKKYNAAYKSGCKSDYLMLDFYEL